MKGRSRPAATWRWKEAEAYGSCTYTLLASSRDSNSHPRKIFAMPDREGHLFCWYGHVMTIRTSHGTCLRYGPRALGRVRSYSSSTIRTTSSSSMKWSTTPDSMAGVTRSVS